MTWTHVSLKLSSLVNKFWYISSLCNYEAHQSFDQTKIFHCRIPFNWHTFHGHEWVSKYTSLRKWLDLQAAANPH